MGFGAGWDGCRGSGSGAASWGSSRGDGPLGGGRVVEETSAEAAMEMADGVDGGCWVGEEWGRTG